MKKECSIVRELLPLFAENMVNEETAEYVKSHLENCEECNDELSRLSDPVVKTVRTNTESLKRIKKQFSRNKLHALLLISAIMIVFFVSLFSYVTSPSYFSYSEDLMTISDAEPNSIRIAFNDKVTGYRLSEEMNPDDNRRIIHIEAWSTIWESVLFRHGDQNAVISLTDDRPIAIYYTRNYSEGRGSLDDYLIYGEQRATQGGVVSSSWLSIKIGPVIASILVAILLVIILVARRKQHVTYWLARLIMAPTAYLLGHLCVMRFSTISYSLMRDLSLIVFVSTAIYCAMLLIWKIHSTRREVERITRNL